MPLALATPPDPVVAPAPGARNLASGGGYLAWSAPDGRRWRLTVREPDGRIVTPDGVPAFTSPPRVSIGSDRRAFAGRRLLAVYARDGDISAYDLRAGGAERRVPRLSSRADERAPSLSQGIWTFVRAGRGLYYLGASQRVRRLNRATPSETVTNGSRVAYPWRGNVVVRHLSGRGRPYFFEAPRARSLLLTRYVVAWLSGERAFATTRLAGSGGPFSPRVRRAPRTLPGAQSIAGWGSAIVGRYLDAEGVRSVEPKLF